MRPLVTSSYSHDVNNNSNSTMCSAWYLDGKTLAYCTAVLSILFTLLTNESLSVLLKNSLLTHNWGTDANYRDWSRGGGWGDYSPTMNFKAS